MFERFVGRFPPGQGSDPEPWGDQRFRRIEGLSELIGIGAGVSFGDGIIRVHSERDSLNSLALVREMFPEFAKSALPIAQDWMGRQFVVNIEDGQILLLEPGSGEAFEIDCGISDLFNAEFVSDPLAYLALDLFDEWVATNSVLPAPGQCVGFKVPLFLGGEGEVSNLEIVDAQVYWALLGQLKTGIKDLPPGAKVSEVSIGLGDE